MPLNPYPETPMTKDLVPLTAGAKSVLTASEVSKSTTKGRALVVNDRSLVPGGPLPSLVTDAGAPGETAWDDFFAGRVRNRSTRNAYERAVRGFLAWAAKKGRKALHEITAGDVGRYIAGLAPEKQGLSKKKQHLAGLRRFFNLQVERHICIINPAAVAETEKLSVMEGKTPTITYDQALQLYDSIDRSTLCGKRDTAVLATLNFSGARAGAIGMLDVDDLRQNQSGWSLWFVDKGNKEKEVPVPHDLQGYLLDWLEASGVREQQRARDKETAQWIPRPLFRNFIRKEQKLAPYRPEKSDPHAGTILQRERGRMTGRDIHRMMKRRLNDAGLPSNLRPHSYRVAIATDLDDQGEPLHIIQGFLSHADPRTTQVYLRRKQEISRNLVERIRVGRTRGPQ